MPLPTFDASRILNPFVTDDDDESSNESSTESEDDTDDDGGTEPVTYGLDPDDVPTVQVTTSSSNGSDDESRPDSFAQWYDDVHRIDHSNRSNSFTAQAEYGGQVELSTEAYDNLREAIREQHSGTFEGQLEQIHQDTSPRQDTLSDAI